MFITDILEQAKKSGYEAVALTDNTNMTGIAEFVNKAPSYGIKPIPGVELNILDDNGELTTIILMVRITRGMSDYARL